jgi:mRNA interferase MazF
MYLRGTIWEFAFEAGAPSKPALIVSNNARNQSAWPDVHVVRITTAPRPSRNTIVELPGGDWISGRVICDDLMPVPKNMLGERLGALSPGTMRRVDVALKVVLALD